MRALVLAALVACTSPPILGPPTGAECPPGSPLTYDNFGKPFMTKYCTQCHSSKLMGSARMGAPDFHDFDTRFGIVGVKDHVDESTAAGPKSFNIGMPQTDPKPTDMERYQLGEWIACGLPE